MAKNNMTFNASIRLNSVQFKKGVADVQKSIKSLQRSFLSLSSAIGLGLSFQRLGASLLDVASKMSDAKDVLTNASNGVREYGESLEWLRKVSNEYGQDLTENIKSFAQLRQAAKYSKLSIEEVRDIYQSLARAAGAYNLSAEKTNGIMRTVGQMLSRGAINSERYVRQLNTALPGAYNMMAQAAYNAGLITENSVEALEKAIKDGKIMADQVLPSFSKVLNDVTSNATFDTLQNSMNRLKNSWTEMVEGANFESLYKGLIDGATSVVKFFTDGFWTKISAAIAGVFGGTVVAKGLNKFVTGVREAASTAEAEYNGLYSSINAQQKKLEKMPGFGAVRELPIKGRSIGGKMGTLEGTAYFISGEELERLKLGEKEMADLARATTKYNEDLIKLSKTQKQLTGKPMFSHGTVRGIEEINDVTKQFAENLEGTGSAFKDFNGQTKLLGSVSAKLASAWRGFVGILKSAFASIAIGAIISGVTYLVGKLIEARKEEKRIAGIAGEIKSSVENVSVAENKTVVQLTLLKRAWEQVGKSTDEALNGQKQQLLDEMNKALGRTGDNLLTLKTGYDEVVKSVDKYIEDLKKAAQQQAILSLVGEKTAKVIQLQAENAGYTADKNYGKTVTTPGYGYTSYGVGIPGNGGPVETLTDKAQKLQNKIDKNNDEIAQLNQGIKDVLEMANEDTLKAIYGGKDTVTTNSGTTSGGTDDSKDTPQAALNKYKEELKKLDNQYKAGAILAEDYKKKVEELNQKSFEELASFGWDTAVKALATSADKDLAEELKKTATAKLLEGLDDPEAIAEFDKEMQDEADKALKKFQEAWDKFIEYKKKKPLIDAVDTSEGYMYSSKKGRGQTYSEYETHFNGEYLKAYEKYVDDLNSYIEDLKSAMSTMTEPAALQRMNELLKETIDKLGLAKLAVKDLKTKANIAQIEKDIQDLKREGLDSVFGSITSLADGTDRLYRAVQSVKQINDDTWKSEELENFLTRLNALIQAFEVIKSIIEAVSAVTTAYAKIKEKESAKAIALNAAEAASESAKATAAAGAAAAGAASSVSSIPYVGPILAVAAVAAVTAAILAGMKKFATGGFVGGNSYTGDKQMVRVNSGELILNPAQQKNLLNLANGKAGAGGGQVDFKIHGADLVGVLKNYNRLRG